MINNKTSLLVPSQLPSFVRENPDYSNFSLFVQSYYEWLEQSGQITDVSKNILNYNDIDSTIDEFLVYFINDFLPYFPSDSLVSPDKAIKLARSLYHNKGIPSSYKLLFKILYNSDFDLFQTKDAVLKASSGIWYVSKSLKLATTDLSFLETKNYRIFGETSKSIATIENAILVGSKIEIFISNIERLFQSGEIVRIVDNNNQDVLINGKTLQSKIVGQISQININPKNRGQYYQSGDPVIVYGGLNANTLNPVGATAHVKETTAGSIKSITLTNGGWGYRAEPNSIINITNGGGAEAVINGLNPESSNVANVSFIPRDIISLKRFITIGNTNYNFSNTATSNANTTLAKALTFDSFSTYPLSSVVLTYSGGGITAPPEVSATSYYGNELYAHTMNYQESIDYTDPSVYSQYFNDLKNIGILAPIQIIDGGLDYKVNNVITFSGGRGYGANAIVANVNSAGSIVSVSYVPGSVPFCPLGGMGYTSDSMPTLTVNTANTHTSNNVATLIVSTILGDGAKFSTVTDRAGEITTITIDNPGEDYISAPNISLKIQDILVSNVSLTLLPLNGDVIYQGSSTSASTYQATVYSITPLVLNGIQSQSTYNIRVYNYNSTPDPSLQLNIKGKNIVMNISDVDYSLNHFYPGSPAYTSGIKVYGDGTASAKASFLNGLVIGQGEYLNSSGQASSFDVLQSDFYNNYTYQITVEKEISKYRDILLNLVHPIGTKVIGRYAVKSNTNYDIHGVDASYQSYNLSHYTGYVGSTATMQADFTNKSNNIITFTSLGVGVNIANFIFSSNNETNTVIQLTSSTGPNVHSEVTYVDYVNNQVRLESNVWLTFANVANITAIAGSNTINIVSLTGAYDIINNGNYSNTAYPLKDIVYAGDKVKIANNNTLTVSSVDYSSGNGKIYVTGTIAYNSNSLLSVNRTLTTTSVQIINTLGGTEYTPALTTENGIYLITEDGKSLIVG